MLLHMKASGILARVWRWIKWPLVVLAVGYIAFSIWGATLVFDKQKTDAAVAQIHAQKITLSDVEGKALPPVPDQAENDATLAGIDKNDNGIRDDVELAIFKEYPNSAKIRAAELQYAMTEQMFLTKVFNTGTWQAVAEEDGRANLCMFKMPGALIKENDVETLVFNTQTRMEARDKAFQFITSHGIASGNPCDVDLNILPN